MGRGREGERKKERCYEQLYRQQTHNQSHAFTRLPNPSRSQPGPPLPMLVLRSLHHPRYEQSRYRAAPFIRLDATLPHALVHLSGVSPLSSFVAACITPATQVSAGTKSRNSLSFSISRAAQQGKRVWSTHSRSSLLSWSSPTNFVLSVRPATESSISPCSFKV